jgi:hypothetical protein
MNKELKKIIRRVEQRGYTVVPAGKHLKIKNADGNTVYTLPSTPSGSLWRVRLATDLKKRGLID